MEDLEWDEEKCPTGILQIEIRRNSVHTCEWRYPSTA